MAFGFSSKNDNGKYLITEQTHTPALHSVLINFDSYSTVLSNFGGSYELTYKVYDCPTVPIPFFTMPVPNKSYSISRIAPDPGDADWTITLLTNASPNDLAPDNEEPPLVFEPVAGYQSNSRMVTSITTTELDFTPIKPTEAATHGSSSFTIGAVHKVPRGLYNNPAVQGMNAGSYFACFDVSSYNTSTQAYTPFIQPILEPTARIQFDGLCDSGKEVSYKMPLTSTTPSDSRYEGLNTILQFNGGDLSYKGGTNWSSTNPEYPNNTYAGAINANIDNDLLGAVKYNWSRGADTPAGSPIPEYSYDSASNTLRLYVTEWGSRNIKQGQYVQYYYRDSSNVTGWTGWKEIDLVGTTSRERNVLVDGQTEVEEYDAYYIELTYDKPPYGAHLEDATSPAQSVSIEGIWGQNNQTVTQYDSMGGVDPFNDRLEFMPDKEGRLWKFTGFFVRGWPSASINWGASDGSTAASTFSSDFTENNIDFFPIPTYHNLAYRYNSYSYNDNLEPDTGTVQDMARRDANAFSSFADLRGLANASTRSTINPVTGEAITVDKYQGVTIEDGIDAGRVVPALATSTPNALIRQFKPQWYRTPYIYHGPSTSDTVEEIFFPKFTYVVAVDAFKPYRLGSTINTSTGGIYQPEITHTLQLGSNLGFNLPLGIKNDSTNVDVDVFNKGNSSERFLGFGSTLGDEYYPELNNNIPGTFVNASGKSCGLVAIKDQAYGAGSLSSTQWRNEVAVLDEEIKFTERDVKLVADATDFNSISGSGPVIAVYDYISLTSNKPTALTFNASLTAVPYTGGYQAVTPDAAPADRGQFSIYDVSVNPGGLSNSLTVTTYTAAHANSNITSATVYGTLSLPSGSGKFYKLPDSTSLSTDANAFLQYGVVRYVVRGYDIEGYYFQTSVDIRIHRTEMDTTWDNYYGSINGIVASNSQLATVNQQGPSDYFQLLSDREQPFSYGIGQDLTRAFIRRHNLSSTNRGWMNAYSYGAFERYRRSELGITTSEHFNTGGFSDSSSTFITEQITQPLVVANAFPGYASQTQLRLRDLARTFGQNIPAQYDKLIVVDPILSTEGHASASQLDYKNNGRKFHYKHKYKGIEWKSLRYPKPDFYCDITANCPTFRSGGETLSNTYKYAIDHTESYENEYQIDLDYIPNLSKNISAVQFGATGRYLNNIGGASVISPNTNLYFQENILSSTIKSNYIIGNTQELFYLGTDGTTVEGTNSYNVPGIFDPEVNPDNEELIYIGLYGKQGSSSVINVNIVNTHSPDTVITRPVSLVLSNYDSLTFNIIVPESVPLNNVFLFANSTVALQFNGTSVSIPSAGGTSTTTVNNRTVTIKRGASGVSGTRFGTPSAGFSSHDQIDSILGLNHEYNSNATSAATKSQTNSSNNNYLSSLTTLKPTSVNCAKEAKELTIAVTSRFYLSSPETFNQTKSSTENGYEIVDDFISENIFPYYPNSGKEYPFLRFSGVCYETDLTQFGYSSSTQFAKPTDNTNDEEVIFVGTQCSKDGTSSFEHINISLVNDYKDQNATDYVSFADSIKEDLYGGAPTRKVSLVLSSAHDAIWNITLDPQVKLENIYIMGLGTQRVTFDNNGSANKGVIYTLTTSGPNSTQTVPAGTYPTSTLPNSISISRYSTEICGYALPSKGISTNTYNPAYGANIFEVRRSSDLGPFSEPGVTLNSTNVNLDRILGFSQSNLAYPSGSNPNNDTLFETWTGKKITSFTGSNDLTSAIFEIKIGTNGKEVELAVSGSVGQEVATDTTSNCTFTELQSGYPNYSKADHSSSFWVDQPTNGLGVCSTTLSDCYHDNFGYGASQKLQKVTENLNEEVILITAHSTPSKSFTYSDINYTTNVITLNSHGYSTGDQLGFSYSSRHRTVISNMDLDTNNYENPNLFVRYLTANTFKLCTTYAGAFSDNDIVEFTTSGTSGSTSTIRHTLRDPLVIEIDNPNKSKRDVTLIISLFQSAPIELKLPQNQFKMNLKRVIIASEDQYSLTYTPYYPIYTWTADLPSSSFPYNGVVAYADGYQFLVESMGLSLGYYSLGVPKIGDFSPRWDSATIDKLLGFNRVVDDVNNIFGDRYIHSNSFDYYPPGTPLIKGIEDSSSLGSSLKVTTWAGVAYKGSKVEIELADTIAQTSFLQYETSAEPFSSQIAKLKLISNPLNGSLTDSTSLTEVSSFNHSVSGTYKNVGNNSAGSGCRFKLLSTAAPNVLHPGEGYRPQGYYSPGALKYEMFAVRATDVGHSALSTSNASVNYSTNIITVPTHYLSTGDMVHYRSAVPEAETLTNLVNNNEYYVKRESSTSISLYNSKLDAIYSAGKINLSREDLSNTVDQYFTPLVLVAPIQVTKANPQFKRAVRTSYNKVSSRGFLSDNLFLLKLHRNTTESSNNSSVWVHDGFNTTPNTVQTIYRGFVPSVASYMGAIDNINGFNVQPYMITQDAYSGSTYNINTGNGHRSSYNSNILSTSSSSYLSTQFFAYNYISALDTPFTATGIGKPWEVEFETFTLATPSNLSSFATRNNSYADAWNCSFSDDESIGFNTLSSMDLPEDATGYVKARWGFLDSAATYTEAVYWEGILVATNASNSSISLPETDIPTTVDNPSAGITAFTAFSASSSDLSASHDFYTVDLGKLTLDSSSHGFLVGDPIYITSLSHNGVLNVDGTSTVVEVSGSTVYYVLRGSVPSDFNNTTGDVSNSPKAILNPFTYYRDTTTETSTNDFIFQSIKKYGPDYLGESKKTRKGWNEGNIPNIYVFSNADSSQTKDATDDFGLQILQAGSYPTLFDSRTVPLLITQTGDVFSNFAPFSKTVTGLSAKRFSNHSSKFTPVNTKVLNTPSGASTAWTGVGQGTHNNTAYYYNAKAQSHKAARFTKTEKKKDCPVCSKRTYHYVCEYWALYRPGVQYNSGLSKLETKYITVQKGALRTKSKKKKGAFSGLFGGGGYDYYQGGLASWNNETINTATEGVLTVNIPNLGLSELNITASLVPPNSSYVQGVTGPALLSNEPKFHPSWTWSGNDRNGASSDNYGFIQMDAGDILKLTIDFVSFGGLALLSSNLPSDDSPSTRKMYLMTDNPWNINNTTPAHVNYTAVTNADAASIAPPSSTFLLPEDIFVDDDDETKKLVFAPKSPGIYYFAFITTQGYYAWGGAPGGYMWHFSGVGIEVRGT